MLSLADVLHEVSLLDLMPAKSLAALVAVNQAHRRQVHNHVSQIRIPDHDHIQTLFRGAWPRLQSWQIGGWLQTYPSGTHSSSYPSRALDELRHLTLCEGSMTAAGTVAQLHKVGWSTLQSCRIEKVGQSSAGIQAFCTYTWPSLLELDLSYCQLDAVAISHLAAASWPCLTILNLHDTGLTHAAFQRLWSGCWPALRHLNISRNNLSMGSSSMLAQSLGPATKVTDWAPQLTVLDLSDNLMTSESSLMASVIEQVTTVHCPCLEKLFLKHIIPDLYIVSHVVQGRWPKLSMLDISEAAIGAPALQMLAQAPWRHLKVLCLDANLQDAAVSEQLTAGSDHHDQRLLHYLQLRHRQPVHFLMYGQPSAQSCLARNRHMELPKCFAQWPDLCIYVFRADTVMPPSMLSNSI